MARVAPATRSEVHDKATTKAAVVALSLRLHFSVFVLFLCSGCACGLTTRQGRWRSGKQLQQHSQRPRFESGTAWNDPMEDQVAAFQLSCKHQHAEEQEGEDVRQQQQQQQQQKRNERQELTSVVLPCSRDWEHQEASPEQKQGHGRAVMPDTWGQARRQHGLQSLSKSLHDPVDLSVAPRMRKLRKQRSKQVGAQARAARAERAERAAQGPQLAASQVPVMREVQSYLQQWEPTWLGDPKTNCCSNAWDGVVCNGAGEVVSMVCGDSNVWYDNTGTPGPFPTAMGALGSLTSLTLRSIMFNTSLPSDLGRLVNLRELELSDLKSLTVQLADLTWLASLWKLTNLVVSSANMDGLFPDDTFLRLTRLTGIYISGINLTTIPFGLDALHGSLLALTMTGANMYGFLPPRLFALSRLTYLDLSDNLLQGSIPSTDLPGLASLEHLDLGRNNLTGAFPKSISRLTRLTVLQLGSNRLAGAIPPDLFAMPSLVSANVDLNRLASPFPTSIGASRASLQSLSLNSNNFSEPLPPSVGLFNSLSYLALSGNDFFSSVPQEWTSLRALVVLNVVGNRLAGSPAELLTRLPRLETVDLSENLFSGALPNEIEPLNILSVRHNQFTGPFPVAVLNTTGMNIDISYNLFSGPIPELVSLWPGLFLYINNNNFSGPLPTSLSLMTQLVELNVSHNQLIGGVPDSLFGESSFLQIADFSFNMFSGLLPSLTRAPQLNLFNARRNRFSGSLTDSFLQFGKWPRFPMYVDVGQNALTGDLSEANFTNAITFGLLLDGNLFAGSIPSSVCGMQNLVALSVADNLLTGEVPSCLYSLPRTLQWLDLSRNVLFGQLGDFQQVDNTLALAVNYFFGRADVTAGSIPLCALGTNGTELVFDPTYFPSLHYRTTVEDNCLTLARNRSPKEACVVRDRQRTALQCGSFCGTVGGSQCGGEGVCQIAPPAAWAASLPLGNASDLERRLADGSMGRLRASLRASLAANATCECKDNFEALREPNGTLTCQLVIPPPSPTAPTADGSNGGLSTGVIVGISLAAALSAVVIGALLFLLLRPKRQRRWADLDVCRQFSAGEIERATGGWSADNLLGEGAFGSVYRGVTPEGEVWAVKRSKLMSNDFETEVRAMASLHHPRLVRLLGFCEDLNEAAGRHEQILVYEFVPGGDLKQWIQESKGKHPPLSLAQLLDIVAGVADGLAYLHSFDPPIVHRDVKPANILVDANLLPKIADFGLLKQLFDGSDATRVAGTPGYVDPDYNRSSTVSVSSDVYSLGIVMLEMLTGRGAAGVKAQPRHVLGWAKPLFEDGDAVGLKDPTVVAPDEAVLEFCLLAMDCTRCPAMFRPTMKDVVTRALAIKVKYAGRIEDVRRFEEEVHEASGGSGSTHGDAPSLSSSGAGTFALSGFSSMLNTSSLSG